MTLIMKEMEYCESIFNNFVFTIPNNKKSSNSEFVDVQQH